MRTAKDQSSLVQSSFFGNPKKEGPVSVLVSGLGVKKPDWTKLSNTMDPPSAPLHPHP